METVTAGVKLRGESAEAKAALAGAGVRGLAVGPGGAEPHAATALATAIAIRAVPRAPSPPDPHAPKVAPTHDRVKGPTVAGPTRFFTAPGCWAACEAT